MNIVILAGGVGTRLWPLGRKNNPKQFFPMISEKSLVRQTYDRFLKTYGPEKIYFSTTSDLVPHLKKIFPNLDGKQFIVEPSRRDTAAAMGFVAAVLSVSEPDEPMVFVPSDHFIADEEKFLNCFKVGEKLIRETGKMLDIGITATFPSTVLGYTEIGDLYKTIDGVEVYNFIGHTEKPDLDVAVRYFEQGNYLWHGNYYMWTPKLFLNALKNYAPEIYKILAEIKNAVESGKLKDVPALYSQIERKSFDYAVTEKIKKEDVLIIKGNFGWSDIGAWDVLHNQMRDGGDSGGNVVKGRVVHLDTKGSLLFGAEKKILGVIGVDGLVVVDTEDALLICPKDRAQDVKKLLAKIEEEGWGNYL